MKEFLIWLTAQSLPVIFSILGIILLIVVLLFFIKNDWAGGFFKKNKKKEIDKKTGVCDNCPKNKNQRSCEDCLMIVRNKITEYERNVFKKETKFREERFNNTSKELLEIQSLLLKRYTNLLKAKGDIDPVQKNHQFKLYYGLIKEALFGIVKDELRRAFKENGFDDKKDSDFQDYVKEEIAKILVIMNDDFLQNMYPSQGMFVESEEILDMNPVMADFSEHIFNIFIKAKELYNNTMGEINMMETAHDVELKDLIGI